MTSDRTLRVVLIGDARSLQRSLETASENIRKFGADAAQQTAGVTALTASENQLSATTAMTTTATRGLIDVTDIKSRSLTAGAEVVRRLTEVQELNTQSMFRLVGTSAALGASLGGPLTQAIGAAAAGLVILITRLLQSGESAEQAQKRIDSYVRSLGDIGSDDVRSRLISAQQHLATLQQEEERLRSTVVSGRLAMEERANALRTLTKSIGEQEREVANLSDALAVLARREADAAQKAFEHAVASGGAATAAFVAAQLLKLTSDDIERVDAAWDRAAETIRSAFEGEIKLRQLIDVLTEAADPGAALRSTLDGLSNSIKGVGDGSDKLKNSITGLKQPTDEQTAALRALEQQLAAAERRSESLAGKFGRLGDELRAGADALVKQLLGAGVSAEEAAAQARAQLAAGATAKIDLLNQALRAGTIDPGTAIRLATALQRGTPDPLLVELGLVPKLAHGGTVERTGIAVVHRGETFSGGGDSMGGVRSVVMPVYLGSTQIATLVLEGVLGLERTGRVRVISVPA